MATAVGELPHPLLAPRFLTRDQAAAYLGVGTTTFDREVADGIWPRATRRGSKGGALTWDRVLLDRAADRLAGIDGGMAEDAALEAATQMALEATRGTAQKNRRQQGHKAQG